MDISQNRGLAYQKHKIPAIPFSLTELCIMGNYYCKRSGSSSDTNAGKGGRRVTFEFAFNEAKYSDRVLHIEIMDDTSDSKSYSEGGRKRKREDSESCNVVKVKTFHINSLLLAGNSPFFHKLFENGMRESQQRDATLRISASEEESVMEVLNFMYTNTLKSTTTLDLLGVLIAADKFEAIECVRCCSEKLQKMPVSLESAAQYLELPSSVLMYEEVQPLIDAAKKCLLAHFKDINKAQKPTMMTLPLSVVEVLLNSYSIQQDLCGDDVYEFILKWARAQYPELNKRREILTKSLSQFIPFRHMSSLKLKEALVCPDLDREKVSNLMLESLISMVKDSHGQNFHSYNKCQVIKVEKSEPHRPHCVVYFDIKKEDCRNLFPSNHLVSQVFCLGPEGQWFYLAAECHLNNEQQHSFGLYLYMCKGSQSCRVDCVFEAMKKSSMKFQNKRGAKDVTYSDTALTWGIPNLFNIPWSDFMSEDSDCFIDGILHLRADITVKNSAA